MFVAEGNADLSQGPLCSGRSQQRRPVVGPSWPRAPPSPSQIREDFRPHLFHLEAPTDPLPRRWPSAGRGPSRVTGWWAGQLAAVLQRGHRPRIWVPPPRRAVCQRRSPASLRSPSGSPTVPSDMLRVTEVEVLPSPAALRATYPVPPAVEKAVLTYQPCPSSDRSVVVHFDVHLRGHPQEKCSNPPSNRTLHNVFGEMNRTFCTMFLVK